MAFVASLPAPIDLRSGSERAENFLSGSRRARGWDRAEPPRHFVKVSRSRRGRGERVLLPTGFEGKPVSPPKPSRRGGGRAPDAGNPRRSRLAHSARGVAGPGVDAGLVVRAWATASAVDESVTKQKIANKSYRTAALSCNLWSDLPHRQPAGAPPERDTAVPAVKSLNTVTLRPPLCARVRRGFLNFAATRRKHDFKIFDF